MSSTRIHKRRPSSAKKISKTSTSRSIHNSSNTINKKSVSDNKVVVLSLTEAINKCNEELMNHPKFDFRGVKVVK